MSATHDIAGPDKTDLISDALEHCMFPLAMVEDVRRDGPTIYVRGEGVRLTEASGRCILDMMSSHTRANSLGYGNREIAQAVYDQMIAVHYVGTVDNFAPATVQLACKLAELAPGRLSRSMFVSGGSEAVEAAIKLAKQYHIHRGTKPRAYKIISRWNAYHGSTMGAVGVTDWHDMRHISEPGVPGVSFVPGPMCFHNPLGMEEDEYADYCARYLELQIQHEGPDMVAAVLVEPIMQGGGVHVPPRRYLERVREICDSYDVLLIIDEVITGFGRTGAWFAIEHFGVEPDIMTMAKALTAGYVPMGAVITRPQIADSLPIFRHVHTFSGHASAAAAANANIAICERDGLIEQARRNGAYLQDALKAALEGIAIVGQVRGLGLWQAVDFTDGKTGGAPAPVEVPVEIVRRVRELGVLVMPQGTAIELAPPLIATRTDLDEAVEAIARAVTEVARDRGIRVGRTV